MLGGGGLMAAFPLAYAIILPALYAPIIAMLLALVFRGVAFEFRWRDPAHRRYWDFAFTTGSIVATLAQGITLGALLQGIAVEGRAYAGGWWDWLTPFSLLVGVSLVIGYALLGATWLIMKTEGSVQEHCFRLAEKFAIARHRLHRAGERGDTVSQRRLLRALVRLASGAVHGAGAAARRPRRPGVLSRRPAPPLGVLAIPARPGAVRSVPARARVSACSRTWSRAP